MNNEIKISIGDQSYVEEVLKPLEQLAEGKEPKESEVTPEVKPSAKEGIISASDLAKDLGIDAKALRKILRDSGFKKEGKRWEWPEDHPQLEEIRKAVAEAEKPKKSKKEAEPKAAAQEPQEGSQTDEDQEAVVSDPEAEGTDLKAALKELRVSILKDAAEEEGA